MAQRVVDLLEVVQIKEKQHQGQAVARGQLHFLRQPVLEHAAVRQAGEEIEIGLLPNQLVRRLLLRNIGEQRHPAMNFAVFADDGVDGEPFRVQLAVLAPVPNLPLPLAGGLDRLPHGPIKRRIVQAGTENFRVFPQHLLRRVTGNLGKGRIDGQYRSLPVGHHHASLLCSYTNDAKRMDSSACLRVLISRQVQ